MSIIGDVVRGVVGIGSTVASNVTNYQMNQENNAYNERLMRESWARDDSAIQRSVADAKAAGFSPLAGLGGAANSGMTPMTASSIDLSGLDSAAGSLTDGILTKREKEEIQRQKDYEDSLRSLQLQSMEEDLKSKQTANTYQEQQIVAGLLQLADKHKLDDADFAEIIGNLKASGVIGEDTDLSALGTTISKDKSKYQEYLNLLKTNDKVVAEIDHIHAQTTSEESKDKLNQARIELTKVQKELAKGDLEAGNQTISLQMPYLTSDGKVETKQFNGSVQNAMSMIEAYITSVSGYYASKDSQWNSNGFNRAVDAIGGVTGILGNLFGD